MLPWLNPALPCHTCAYVDLGKKEEEGDDSWANCKFHAMLATGSTCHVRPKGQNGPAVNHLKKFLDPEVESKGQMKGYVPTVNHLKSLLT